MSVGAISEPWAQPLLRQAARKVAADGDWSGAGEDGVVRHKPDAFVSCQARMKSHRSYHYQSDARLLMALQSIPRPGVLCYCQCNY